MRIQLEIQNLKCRGCANTIITKLSQIKNIRDVIVDVDKSFVGFICSDNNDVFSVKKELSHIGYPIIGDKNVLTTKAKSFVSCALGKFK